MNLNKRTYSPYKKPSEKNTIYQYLIQPPTTNNYTLTYFNQWKILEKLLNEEIFNKLKAHYEKTLKDSGFQSTKLEYEKKTAGKHSQNRSWNIIWFNPPFNKYDSTNAPNGTLFSLKNSNVYRRAILWALLEYQKKNKPNFHQLKNIQLDSLSSAERCGICLILEVAEILDYQVF